MATVIHISDVVKPKMGNAIYIKPMIDNYVARYNILNAKHEIKCYFLKDGDSYIAHVKIPSEENEKFEKKIYYDVIVEFYPETKAQKELTSIADYGIKVFSNSISWIFNFTYVFYKNGCTPKFMPKKYFMETAITKPPAVTNPYGIYGIERVVFMAFHHLEQMTSYKKEIIDLLIMPKMNIPDMVKSILSQDEKLAQLQLEKKKVSLANKKSKLEKQKYIIKQKEKKEDVVNKQTDILESKMATSMKNDSLKKNLKKDLKADFKASLSKKKK